MLPLLNGALGGQANTIQVRASEASHCVSEYNGQWGPTRAPATAKRPNEALHVQALPLPRRLALLPQQQSDQEGWGRGVLWPNSFLRCVSKLITNSTLVQKTDLCNYLNDDAISWPVRWKFILHTHIVSPAQAKRRRRQNVCVYLFGLYLNEWSLWVELVLDGVPSQREGAVFWEALSGHSRLLWCEAECQKRKRK